MGAKRKMARLCCGLTLAAAFAMGAFPTRAKGQAVERLPANPTPFVPGPPAPVLGTPTPAPPVGQAPPVGPLTVVPPPPPLPVTDPGPDGWGPYGPPSNPEGYFFAVELQVVKPELNNRISNEKPVVAGGTILIPSVGLDWTVSPKFEFGYRLPESLGLFAASYRFLVSEGTGQRTQEGIDFGARTRVDVNTLDLDYGNRFPATWPRWDFSYRLGIRLSDIYFDSNGTAAGLFERGSNNYVGAGPHLRLDAERCCGFLPGFSLYGSIDGGLLVGKVQQHFHEEVTGPDGTVVTGDDSRRRTQSIPMLDLQLGFGYTPAALPNVHFRTGYQYEHYWSLGSLGLEPDGTLLGSRAELSSQGWFLRTQIDF
jgi:hypothetical protein